MRRFSLIGYPLGHTMSPPIHARLFALSGHHNVEYEVVEVAPDLLPKKTEVLFELDGFNVTIPHKVAIIPFLDTLDETAKRYGAVNVVDCKGKKTGYNTDVVGFKRAIENLGASLDQKTVLLGCGGAGRMMAIETAFCGGELTIAVREADIDAAQELCEQIKRKVPTARVEITTLDKIEGDFSLLINATPVGMYPNMEAMPVSEDVISRSEFVFDAIYNPYETKLIKTAKELGKKAAGGMAMLVWQAVVAHEIWDDAQYNTQDIVTLISDMEQAVKSEFK